MWLRLLKSKKAKALATILVIAALSAVGVPAPVATLISEVVVEFTAAELTEEE